MSDFYTYSQFSVLTGYKRILYNLNNVILKGQIKMAKFELSAFTDEYSQDMSEQIKGMLANGIKYTELRGVNGKNVSEITKDEAKEVKNMLDANGLAVWSVGSPASISTL